VQTTKQVELASTAVITSYSLSPGPTRALPEALVAVDWGPAVRPEFGRGVGALLAEGQQAA